VIESQLSLLPSATIVLPVTNGWETTFRALLALAERSKGTRREVIVVDNGCTDDTRVALPHLEGLRVIRNEKDQGFVRACNQAAANAHGQVLVFLDRDAEVGSGWLERLARIFVDVHVAAVCPPDSLSGAFLAVRTADYRQAGGLDEKSVTAADDLLARLIRSDRRVQVAEDVPVTMPAAPIARPEPIRPPVSVVVPVHDCGPTLAACLRGVERNLLPVDEVLIADGASQDETLRLAYEFASRHHRTARVMDQAGDVTGAALKGLGAASREFALVIHPCVEIPNGFIDGVVALFAGNANAGAIAIQVPRTGVCVFGRSDDMRTVGASDVSALFQDDGLALGRALQRMGSRLAYVPAPQAEARAETNPGKPGPSSASPGAQTALIPREIERMIGG